MTELDLNQPFNLTTHDYDAEYKRKMQDLASLLDDPEENELTDFEYEFIEDNEERENFTDEQKKVIDEICGKYSL